MIDNATVERLMREANPIVDAGAVDADEFARFVAVAHARRATIMQGPDQHLTPQPVAAPPLHRHRRAWAVSAAFLVLVATIGIVALFTRGSDDAPFADEPTAPVTVTALPTTEAAPPEGLRSLTWSRVPHGAAIFDPTSGIDIMTSVTAGGPGFVAVGTTGAVDMEEGSLNAAVWISEDGITWSRVLNDAPPLGGALQQEVEDVTVGGPGLVMVGREWRQPLGGQAAVWTSEDGMSWSRVPHDNAVFGSGGMSDVTAGGPGLVAVGGEDVWTSVDGLTWTRVPLSPEAALSPEAGGAMKSVTVGGPGLVAVGFAGRAPEEGCNAAVWTSPDGLTWSRVPHDETVFGRAVMSDVTAGGPGLVAVGSAENNADGSAGNRAAVWTSPDGFTWTRVPHDAAVFGGEGTDVRLMNAVTSVGSQLVAVGSADSESTPERPAAFVWTSVDGLTWTRIYAGPGRMNDVAVTIRGLIAVGQEGDAAAVWDATEG